MTPQEQALALQGQRPGWNPAPQAPNVLAPAAQPQQQAQRAGIGGEGWNEDFDQAWGNRMMQRYGVSMEDLRDPGTRKWLNKQQRQAQGPQTGGPDPKPTEQKPTSGNTLPTTPGQYGGINPGGNTYPTGGGAEAQARALNPSALLDRRRAPGPAQQGGGGLV